MLSYKSLLNLIFVAILTQSLSSCTQCTRQYDPTKNRQLLDKEREVANVTPTTLSDSGDLPSSNIKAVDPAERFATFCSNCHGPKGMGDGPSSAGLSPKPRNFHDKTWQASVDDQRIYNVIKNGGASVGLSATMAPWGSLLSDEEIKALVGLIRGLGKS